MAGLVSCFASGQIAIVSERPRRHWDDARSGRAVKEMATMATSYQGNVSPTAQSAQDEVAGPIIQKISLSDLHEALRLGWDDFKAVPSHAVVLCVIYPVLGIVLARVA